MRGMVLAAGLGTRLRPITERLPKPLVPILNVPNILFNLLLLKRAGIREIIINLHHLQDKIEHSLQEGSLWGLKLHYSKEKVLLGTAGGLKKAEWFLGGGTFVLANCDFITNTDLSPYLRRHHEENSEASMILCQPRPEMKHYSRVGVDRESHLVSLPALTTHAAARTGIFTGIHILNPGVFRTLKEEPSGINEVLYPQLMKTLPQQVNGYFLENSDFWFDTGDLYHIWESSLKLLEFLSQDKKGFLSEIVRTAGYSLDQKGIYAQSTLPKGLEIKPPVLIGKDCRLPERGSLGPYVILGDRCEFEEGIEITKSVVLSGAKVPAIPLANQIFYEASSIVPIAPLGE